MKTRIGLSLTLMVSILLLFSGLSPVSGNTLTVNTLVDENDGECAVDCSLRDAISLAITGDTINFSVTGTFTLNTPLSINKVLTITGGGWDQQRISGNYTHRVFEVTTLGNLTLSWVTVEKGRADYGAGIYNEGILTTHGVVYVNNYATVKGGAVHNLGAFSLYTGAVSSNHADWDGGGINNQGSLIVERTTFYDNNATYGGAIKNEGGVATITNASFYQNTATSRGAGIDSGSSSTLTLVNSTFYNNTGNGAVGNPSSITTLINTLIAGTSGDDCSGDDFSIASNHNLATDVSCSPGFSQVPLDTLRLNWTSGYYLTIGWGSTAVDAGNNIGCALVDQMNQTRPFDGDGDGSAVCDVGSDELVINQILFLPLVVR